MGDVRLRVSSALCLEREDFGDDAEYNDFLEDREDVIFAMEEKTDVAAAERKLAEMQRRHEGKVVGARARMAAKATQADDKAGAGDNARMSVDAGEVATVAPTTTPFMTFDDSTEEGRKERSRVARDAGGADPAFAAKRARDAAFEGLVAV